MPWERSKADCLDIVKRLSREELEAFLDVNNEIKRRTSYGFRKEVVKKDNSTVLVWSNSREEWIPMPPDSIYGEKTSKAGNVIELDANMILVPFSYDVVKKFAKCLEPLPLYYCSREAVERGKVPPEEAAFCWALKQLERIKQEK